MRRRRHKSTLVPYTTLFRSMASPFDTHGAGITGLIFKKSDTELGRSANFVTIGFTYHGVKVGDVISLRFYGYRDSTLDRKSTRLNSSHMSISYAVFCLKKKI